MHSLQSTTDSYRILRSWKQAIWSDKPLNKYTKNWVGTDFGALWQPIAWPYQSLRYKGSVESLPKIDKGRVIWKHRLYLLKQQLLRMGRAKRSMMTSNSSLIILSRYEQRFWGFCLRLFPLPGLESVDACSNQSRHQVHVTELQNLPHIKTD